MSVLFGIIYRVDNSSADFVNITAYLHDVFGGAPRPGIIERKLIGSVTANGLSDRGIVMLKANKMIDERRQKAPINFISTLMVPYLYHNSVYANPNP